MQYKTNKPYILTELNFRAQDAQQGDSGCKMENIHGFLGIIE